MNKAARIAGLLLAKANDPAVSDNEAAAFMGKARQIMEKHGISEIPKPGEIPALAVELPDPLLEVLEAGIFYFSSPLGVGYRVENTRKKATFWVFQGRDSGVVVKLLNDQMGLGREKLVPGSWDAVLEARGYALGWAKGVSEKLAMSKGVQTSGAVFVGKSVHYDHLAFNQGISDGRNFSFLQLR